MTKIPTYGAKVTGMITILSHLAVGIYYSPAALTLSSLGSCAPYSMSCCKFRFKLPKICSRIPSSNI